MKLQTKFIRFKMGLLAGIATISAGPVAQAALDLLPNDTPNYAVIFEGSGPGNQALSINSAPFNGSTILGNIGLGIPNNGNPFLSGNPQIVINGDVNFAGTPSVSLAGGTLNGTVNGNVGQVTTDLNAINNLSVNLGEQPGTPLTVSGTQTINASSGTFSDAYDAYVFNLTSLALGNANTLTVDGQGLNANVVINVNSSILSSPSFSGAITLAGGLTPDNLIINLVGGSITTLNGGPNLNTTAGGAEQDVTYIDPTGVITVNSVHIMGHVFGGDQAGMNIVSDGTVQVPEPGTLALAAMGGISVIILRHRRSGRRI